ncbi:hypothetical protein L1987_58768 [Smallanthus sonchifolius]|uniref:Uncharacterized protein n=1 Tax=Smallanthus sonchifolius TaxID=185202 RepID=A0ACB9D3Y9_9ASTR|nr:hypothetical protein L1987_58768 [Smallanthus sonchifolius]
MCTWRNSPSIFKGSPHFRFPRERLVVPSCIEVFVDEEECSENHFPSIPSISVQLMMTTRMECAYDQSKQRDLIVESRRHGILERESKAPFQ